jgi:hypothetical protein
LVAENLVVELANNIAMDDLVPLNKGDISTMLYNATFALNNFWLLGNDYGYGQKSSEMVLSCGMCGGLSCG